MSQCPKCRRRLRDGAIGCLCGWSIAEGEVAFAHCAHDDCSFKAIARIKTPTGMADFCLAHYDAYWSKVAADWCAERGLDTREKQYLFIRKTVREGKLFQQVQLPKMREPGEDEEFHL